jgi:tetratricopeptide (TPR) repeat protein
MCRVRLTLAALGVLLVTGPRLSAGLYDPRQPTSPLVGPQGVRPLPFELFRDELNGLLRISDPLQPAGPRQKALDRRSALLARGPDALAPNELAELAYIQYRLRSPDAALAALRQAYGRDRRNFWVLANLGTIYQGTGQLFEASPFLEEARDALPSPWPAGPPATGDWFKQVERQQLSLLRLRLREGAGRPGSRGGPVTEVDALFPVRFLGPTGNYEAGTLADAEKAKLPADAVPLVQQLLLWFPDDTRLYWLLGELYNAQGDLASAAAVFEECVWTRKFDSPTLREHRRVVKEALAALPPPTPAPDGEADRPKERLLPDKFTLWVVGGVSGALLVALGWWQLRELRRRLRSPSPRT